MVFIEGLKPGRGIKLPPEVREQFAREDEQMARIRAFWEEHTAEFLEQYPDQFVAIDIDAGAAIATDPDLLALTATIREMGLTPTDLAVEFMRTNPNVAW